MSSIRENSESFLPGAARRADASSHAVEAAPNVMLAECLVAAVVFVNEASFRDASQETFSVDWQVLLRLAVCAGCGLYALRYLRTAWLALEKFPAALVAIFGIWCAVTVPFSVNVIYAAASCAALWCVILFTPVAILHLGPKRLFLSVFYSLAAFALVSCILCYLVPETRTEFFSPDGEIVYRLGGLSHANGLGRQMALMVMAGLFLGSQKLVSWMKLVPGLLLALVTLYLTNSRTSMLALGVAAICLFVEWSAARGHLGKVLFAASVLAIVAAIALLVTGGFDSDRLLGSMSRSGTSDEMYTFTGRTDIWQYAIKRIAESPVVGYGCGCSRFPMCHFDGFVITHAHNLLLNVMINTGILGGVIIAIAFVTQIWQVFTRPGAFPDMMAVLVLVFAVSDIPLFSVVPDAPTLLWIAAMVWRPLMDVVPASAKEVAS